MPREEGPHIYGPFVAMSKIMTGNDPKSHVWITKTEAERMFERGELEVDERNSTLWSVAYRYKASGRAEGG